MKDTHLLIDGMLSGTGVRDAANGGYLKPSTLGLSDELRARIETWLSKYEDAHFHQFSDQQNNADLDQEGLELARLVRQQLPEACVGYFSNATMREIQF